MQANEKKDIGKLLADSNGVTRAMTRAVRQALLQHKRMGNPVATWRDGKVVWVEPEDIEVSEEDGKGVV